MLKVSIKPSLGVGVPDKDELDSTKTPAEDEEVSISSLLTGLVVPMPTLPFVKLRKN